MQPEPRWDADDALHPQAYRNIQQIVTENEIELLKTVRQYRESRHAGDWITLNYQEQVDLIWQIRRLTDHEGNAFLLELQKLCRDPSEYAEWARRAPRAFASVARRRWLHLTDGMAFQSVTSDYAAHVDALNCNAELYVLNDVRSKADAQALEIWEQHAAAMKENRLVGRAATLNDALEGKESTEFNRSERSKTGPDPDIKNANRVLEIIERTVGNGNWKSRIMDICQELDVAKVPLPKTWVKREDALESWVEAATLEPELTLKAIQYRLKLARK